MKLATHQHPRLGRHGQDLPARQPLPRVAAAAGDGRRKDLPQPDKIVAMTFTRKGAGEFAERILHRLAVAAGDAAELDKLQADLGLLVQGDESRGIAGLAPGVDLAVDAATLQAALAVMVDQFDRLVLGTIDSFMARSVQTLAFELGLGGFEILEEAAIERQREELLAEVLRSVPRRRPGNLLPDLQARHAEVVQQPAKGPGAIRERLPPAAPRSPGGGGLGWKRFLEWKAFQSRRITNGNRMPPRSRTKSRSTTSGIRPLPKRFATDPELAGSAELPGQAPATCHPG